HPGDIRLVDVHLNLQRVHVHERGDAGTGEAAAGGDGGDDLAALRVFRDHDAVKGCAHGAVVSVLLGHADASVGGPDLLFGQGDLGVKAFSRGFGGVERLLADHARAAKALGTLRLAVGVGGLDFKVGEDSGGSIAVSFCRGQGGVRLGAIEGGQNLPGLNAQ